MKILVNVKTNKILTPFFPGIQHSQFIRFKEPSGFLEGRATNPWNKQVKVKEQNGGLFAEISQLSITKEIKQNPTTQEK